MQSVEDLRKKALPVLDVVNGQERSGHNAWKRVSVKAQTSHNVHKISIIKTWRSLLYEDCRHGYKYKGELYRLITKVKRPEDIKATTYQTY